MAEQPSHAATSKVRVSNVQLVNPFVCRMWPGHNRLAELITEKSCKDEIASFLEHGQKHPVLGRSLRDHPQYEIELIYGARRLFVAQHLNARLLVDVQDIDDRTAFLEMDIENRLRQDVSPYERGMAYKEWLRFGYFKNQKDLASAIGVSNAHVSRLLKFAELPSVVVKSFGDLTGIKESWAVTLAERCKDPQAKQQMISVARRLEPEKDRFQPPETLKLLLDHGDSKRRQRMSRTDTIVRSDGGVALFRISYRAKDVHIVVPRDRARSETIDNVAGVLKGLIQEDSQVKSRKPLNQETKYPKWREFTGVMAARPELVQTVHAAAPPTVR